MIGYADITGQVTITYGMTYEMAKQLPYCHGLKLDEGRIYAPVRDEKKAISSIKLQAQTLGLGDFAPEKVAARAARAATAEVHKAATLVAPAAQPPASSYSHREYCPGCGLPLNRHGECRECGVMDVY